MVHRFKLGPTLVVRNAHGAISLVVGHPRPEGAVDRDLQVVGPQPVSVCVRVGEETTLHQHRAEQCDHKSIKQCRLSPVALVMFTELL